MINQLTYQLSRPVTFLTYGSPLPRLCAPLYTVYFGPHRLRMTVSFRPGGRSNRMAGRPWRNLFRPSDRRAAGQVERPGEIGGERIRAR